MNIGPRLVIQGTILGSMVIAVFGFLVSASAAPLDSNVSSVPLNMSIAQPAVASSEHSPTAQKDQKEPKKKQAKETAQCAVSNKYPESIRQWCTLITRYARKHGLDPNLVAAVILQESGGQPLAYSKSGAVGLMQVMPRDGIAASFMCVNGPCFASRPTIEELQDPEFNIDYGTRMLAGLENRLGSMREALKSYGPKDVGYHYADIVLAIYQRYQ